MKLLYLVHRIPYPPNKGDKVRSFHLLQHLAEKHEVYLGSFIDDPEDEPYASELSRWCKESHLARLHPRSARLASLRGLVTGEPLSLPYYRDAGLTAWVRDVVKRERIEGVLVFSSTMAQYALDLQLPVWVDFVDLDSAKWRDYAPKHRWPMSWIYAREGRRLLGYERRVTAAAQKVFFVTPAECELFLSAAPEFRASGKVQAIGNGVDAEFFSPQPALPSPYDADEIPLVFTGAMDYWPNVDAVSWFVRDMLPALRERWPALRFSIVGRNPTPEVLALQGPAVRVTGTVPDVRPYLQHARAVVAPLRLARGIQNKVLEAMAMEQPVITSSACASVIGARLNESLMAADEPATIVDALQALLSEPERAARIGQAARAHVLAHFAWSAQLAPLP